MKVPIKINIKHHILTRIKDVERRLIFVASPSASASASSSSLWPLCPAVRRRRERKRERKRRERDMGQEIMDSSKT
jgi:hypothetical protein